MIPHGKYKAHRECKQTPAARSDLAPTVYDDFSIEDCTDLEEVLERILESDSY